MISRYVMTDEEFEALLALNGWLKRGGLAFKFLALKFQGL